MDAAPPKGNLGVNEIQICPYQSHSEVELNLICTPEVQEGK